jgi:hypothetical protein
MSAVKVCHRIQFSRTEQPQAPGQSEHEKIVACLYNVVTINLIVSQCSDTIAPFVNIILSLKGNVATYVPDYTVAKSRRLQYDTGIASAFFCKKCHNSHPVNLLLKKIYIQFLT